MILEIANDLWESCMQTLRAVWAQVSKVIILVLKMSVIVIFPLKGLFVCKSLTCVFVQISPYVFRIMDLFLSKFLICPPVFVCRCACSVSQMFMPICLWACVYICVTWGCNFSKDSFIKWGEASEEAVNQFYLLCVGVNSLGTPGPCHQWNGPAGFCCCSCVVIGWSGKEFYPAIILHLRNWFLSEESVSNIQYTTWWAG